MCSGVGDEEVSSIFPWLTFFTLVVYHQALVTILDHYTLDAVENPKIQRLKERLSPYVFKTIWRKGAEHAIPDALFRAPVADPTTEDVAFDKELLAHVHSVTRLQVTSIVGDDEESTSLSDPVLDSLRASAANDTEYMSLITSVTDGFSTLHVCLHMLPQGVYTD